MLRFLPPAGALALALLCTPAAATEWGYAHGTEGWGALDPAFAACSSGSQQSPIDVISARSAPTTAPPLSFHYATSAAFSIDHLGHTVQATVPAGNSLSIGSKVYQLVQFHFHTPSENFLDGEQYPLELHLVHRASDDTLAVVGVFFDEGAADAQLQKLVAVLPHEEGEHGNVSAFNLRSLVPAGRIHRFKGSLTTPPCSENVSWHVVSTRKSASLQQLAAFGALFSGAEFPGGNRRPVQSLNGRALGHRSGD
ncbi:carbonic anhydrase [Lysobacter sp. CA199]|uniref:carbonic anhydrase n=1 Tax=Lysobacter sp. CA199 TaxID=3455608 RepID=UPI003F8D00C2